MTLLSAHERVEERMGTLGRIFARADRTLCGRPIAIAIAKRGPAPAWSEDNRITFNISKIGSLSTIEDIVVANGLNYHELAHVMYTPGSNSILRRKIDGYLADKSAAVYDQVMRAFNILEDQRIETLFTQRFRASVPYFEMTFMRHCMSPSAELDYVFPLAWGRRYLSHDVRRELALAYHQQSKVRTIKRLIDRYRTMVFTAKGTEDEALDIIVKFSKIIFPKTEAQDPFGHAAGNDPLHNRSDPAVPTRKQEQDAEAAREETNEQDREEAAEERRRKREAKKEAEGQEDQESSEGADGADWDADGADGDDGDDDDSSGSGDGESDDVAGGDADEGDAPTDIDSILDDPLLEDEDVDDEDQADGEDGAGGTGGGNAVKDKVSEGEVKPRDAVRAAMEEAMQEIMEDREVLRDAGNDLEVLKSGDGASLTHVGSSRGYGTTKPDPIQANVARKIGQEFSTLVIDSDPGFHSHQSSGRLNIQRAMMGADLDVVFDQWAEGKNDAADVDLLIAADVSGSMLGVLDQLSQSVWAIKAGVESIRNDIVVPVYTFGTTSTRIAEYDQRAKWDRSVVLDIDGYTNPGPVLDDARRYFAASRHKHKVFMIITDGSWDHRGDPYEYDRVITTLKAAGILVVVAYLDARPHKEYDVPKIREQYGHGASVFGVIEKGRMGDLVALAKSVVQQSMKN